MSSLEIKNAVIDGARIKTDDGFLDFWLTLDYGGSKQGMGGYVLYAPSGRTKVRANYAGHYIWRVMEVVGVHDLDDLVGKTVRVKSDHCKVHSIGHIIKDVWFNPSEELKKMEEASHALV